MSKNYLIILYGHADANSEHGSHLSVISEYSKEESITKAAAIFHREKYLDMAIYINGVFAESDSRSDPSFINTGDEWNQEIRDEAYIMLKEIGKIVKNKIAEEEAIKKKKEEEKKLAAAKAALESQKTRDQVNLKKLLLQYPDYAKRVLRSEAAADE